MGVEKVKLIASNSIVLLLIHTRAVICDGASDRLLSDSKFKIGNTRMCVRSGQESKFKL